MKKGRNSCNFFVVKRYKICSLTDNSSPINITIRARLPEFFNFISAIFMKNKEN